MGRLFPLSSVDTVVVDVFCVRARSTMDPIAYRFAVTQHDGMRLTYAGTTSVACKLNIWEGTELVPPHLHTPHRSNVSVTALAAIRYARKNPFEIQY